MITKIIGTGSYLPFNTVTNDDLAKIMDTSDEWISSRTGIRERHLVKEENTTFMCVEAAKRALANAGVTAEEIDIIIDGNTNTGNAKKMIAAGATGLVAGTSSMLRGLDTFPQAYDDYVRAIAED